MEIAIEFRVYCLYLFQKKYFTRILISSFEKLNRNTLTKTGDRRKGTDNVDFTVDLMIDKKIK